MEIANGTRILERNLRKYSRTLLLGAAAVALMGLAACHCGAHQHADPHWAHGRWHPAGGHDCGYI